MNHLPQTVLIAARAKSLRLATAESCTGGLIAAALTDIAGSSDVFDRGFVTYSNEAKRDMLGVPWPLLLAKGAVSAEIAKAMAAGALARSDADIAVSVTGIAGPGGGTADKPVGLVYFGVASAYGVRFERRVFPKGSRAFVRTNTVEMALRLFLAEIGA